MSQDVTNNFRIGISGSLEKNVSSEIIAFSEYTGFSANYNKPNYRFGLNLEYLLKGNLKLNGAVNYSNKDFTGTYFCDVCDFDFPPGAEEVDFSFIEVPISLRYYFIPRRIQFFGEIGLNNIFTLNNPAYEARVNSYVIGYKLGGGLEYNLSKKIALQLALDYNKSISKLFKDSYFEGDYFKLRSINFIITILKKMALV
jgi:opacity protein-like surface antigen